jgi:hypothetical protein
VKAVQHACHRYVPIALILTLISSCQRQDPAVTPSPDDRSGLIVDTRSGTVEGQAEDTVLVFKGIPYAAPPVGDARWKPPAAVSAWSEVLQAKDYGPACIAPTRRVQSIYASDYGPFINYLTLFLNFI